MIWSKLKSKKSISYLLRSLKRHWYSSRSVDVYSNSPSSISHTSWTTCCPSLASPHNSCTPSACTCSQPGLAITCHLLITCHLPITCPRENIFSPQRFLPLPLNQLVDCWISIGCPPHKRRWLSCVWPLSSLTHLIDVSTPAEVFSFYVRFDEKAASCWWRLGSTRVAKILPPPVTLPWIQTNSVIIMSWWWKWCKIPRWIKAWSLRGWWPHVLMFSCMRARFNSPLRNRIIKTITTISKFLWRYVLECYSDY